MLKQIKYFQTVVRCSSFSEAAADSCFSHLAVEVSGEEMSVEWLEAVTDEEYEKLG